MVTLQLIEQAPLTSLVACRYRRAMDDKSLAKQAYEAGSPTVARVLAGEICAGCGLCAGVSQGSIEMTIDDKGFARPLATQPVPPESEAMISAACPGKVIEGWTDGPDTTTHDYWGPVGEVAVAHATDDAIRFAGSSGGIVSAIAAHALETRLVEGVVHIGPDAVDPIKSCVRVSRDAASIIAAAGSRYAPSPALASIGALLVGGERLLLIGKPCDISAMRRLAKHDPRVDRTFPYMLSFFCGGVPSELGTRAVLDRLGLAGAALAALRYRGDGWPGQFVAKTVDGRAGMMSYAESWGAHLSSRVQYRCKICPDSVGGVADLAAADAWYGSESGYPQFDEAEGRSLAIVRTAKGAELWRSAIAHGVIARSPLPIEAIAAMQPGQTRRKRLIGARTLAARLLLQKLPSMPDLRVREAGRTAGWGEWLRNLFGSVRRIILRRR